jgi:predicted PurR-regulated permease PerM
MAENQRDLTRNLLAVLFIGGLLAASFWVLRPFLTGFIWAVMIVVATWPLMRALQSLLWGRRWLAVTVMTVVLLVLLIVPFTAAITTIVTHADTLAGWAKTLGEYHPPPAPPAWLAGLPVFGDQALRIWQQLADGGAKTLMSEITPYAGALTKWFVEQAGSLGVLFVEMLLTVVFAVILYARGEQAGDWVRRFGRRLGGRRGDTAVKLSVQAIRGVALGVVVTALVQALLGGLGLVIAGVPFAALLTALMFILSVAQIGALPVLVPVVIWLFWINEAALGSVLLIITVGVSLLDNILRPVLIRQGANLPILLVFLGVIGGLVAFGLIGIFVGPMVLAVSYTLLGAWIAERK